MSASAEKVADQGVEVFSSRKRVENLRQRVRSGPTRRSRKRVRKAEIDHFPALVGNNKNDTPVFFASDTLVTSTPTLQSLTYKKHYTNYCEAVECGIELAEAVAEMQALVPKRAVPSFVPTSEHTYRNKHVVKGSKHTTKQKHTRSSSYSRMEGMHIPCLKRTIPKIITASATSIATSVPASMASSTTTRAKRNTCFGSRPITHKSLANQQLHDRIRRLKGVRSNAYNLGRSKLDRFLRTARRHQGRATMSMEPVWETLALTWAYDQQRSLATPSVCALAATHAPIQGQHFTANPVLIC